MWGVSARDFIKDLKAIQAPTIEISINSPGGSLFDAVAIFSALRASGKQIVTKVAGIAASAASYILQAGDKRVAPENTFVMMHNPIMGVYGNAEQMSEAVDILEKVGASMRATYQSRSGMTDEQMNDLFAGDGTYLTAQEAKDLGLLDEVTPAIQVSASFDTDRLPENIKALLEPEVQAPADPVKEESPLEPTLAEQMQAALEKSGLQAYAETYALAFTDMASLQAAISNAREVKALCAVLAEDATPFIQARKSIADVRAALLAKRSADPEIDTAPAPETGGAPNTAQPSATTADIWAARRKS